MLCSGKIREILALTKRRVRHVLCGYTWRCLGQSCGQVGIYSYRLERRIGVLLIAPQELISPCPGAKPKPLHLYPGCYRQRRAERAAAQPQQPHRGLWRAAHLALTIDLAPPD